MSDQTNETDVKASDANENGEEAEGLLSLEAKAGLSLICILAAAFSFMVWQQWKERQSAKTSGTGNEPAAETSDETDANSPEASDKPEIELVKDDPSVPPGNDKPEVASSQSDENENSSLPPVLNLSTPENGESAEANPVAEGSGAGGRRPANIPTLSPPKGASATASGPSGDDFDPFGTVPEATSDSDSPVTSSASVADAEMKQPDEPDPFAEEPEPASPAEIATKEMTPAEEFNPFASDQSGNDLSPAETKPAESTGDPGTDPFSDQTKPAAPDRTPDPFAAAPDPFAEPAAEGDQPETNSKPPALGFPDAEREPSDEPPPAQTVDVDPFGEIKSKPDRSAEPETESITDNETSRPPLKETPGESFQEPLPLLEPVPDSDESPAGKGDPFGEFESVPAGAAQASSVTQVAPAEGNNRRRGTLADLDAPASLDLSSSKEAAPVDPGPFSDPNPTPKPLTSEFQLNPDGTYEIREGDSYWLISRKAYGTSRYFQALAEYNRKIIANPQQMTTGKKISIPSPGELERKLSHLIPNSAPAPAPSIELTSAEQETGFFTDEQGNPLYRVQKNDTLTGISQRHLGRSSRWIQIYELNRDNLTDPNQLKIGTVLKLPGDASRVRVVRGQ